MATQQQLEQWLQEGIIAAKAGHREKARFRLLDVVEQNQTNETAWYWLYQLFDHLEDKRTCLENLLTINPSNEWARQELLNSLDRPVSLTAESQGGQARQGRSAAKARPAAKKRKQTGGTILSPYAVTLNLITAFWVGISTILLGGGIIAFGEWLISTLRARNFPNYLTLFQVFELLVAIALIIAGISGLSVAILLFFRSMAGFYGSILLALGLLLSGPLVSLIATPPNYVTMLCTGGISGMIVVLTLASQPGFDDT